MREIKFKVWDEDLNEICDVYGLDKIYVRYVSRPHTPKEAMYQSELSTVKLMQFTGLEDKNGDELYEGDVIRYISEGSLKVKYSKIFFKDGEFSYLDYCHDNINKTNYPLSAIASEKGIEHEGSHFCEKLGNIYENPELLKELE